MPPTWESWKTEWDACVKCPIGQVAHRHVIGAGSQKARILFIGEGPGKSEDVLGLPFVGRAGRLLDHMLTEADRSRDEYFITNLVACRPTNERGGDNRQPDGDEILNCKPRLEQLLELLHPRAIVLVGRPAQQWGQVMLRKLKWRGPILLLTHPAAFLRQGGPKAFGYPKAVRDLKRFLTAYS